MYRSIRPPHFALVDWSGRIIREDKRGTIEQALPPILERLNVDEKQWHLLATKFEQQFKSFAGCKSSFVRYQEILTLKRTPPNLIPV